MKYSREPSEAKTIDEGKITREMINAGWEILIRFEPGFDNREEILIEIYRAMEVARVKGLCADADE